MTKQTTPKKKTNRGSGVGKRDTIALYVRMKNKTAAHVRRVAETRGYPHTIASVAGEMMDLGCETAERIERETTARLRTEKAS
jgi:hypothetical protein